LLRATGEFRPRWRQGRGPRSRWKTKGKWSAVRRAAGEWSPPRPCAPCMGRCRPHPLHLL